jgi:hypothetical protein
MTESLAKVEQLASELCALPLSELSADEANDRIVGVLGDEDQDIRIAALCMASELLRQRTEAAIKKGEMWPMIERLSNAVGVPDGVSSVTRLLELGLIEPDGAGGYLATARSRPRAV